VAAGALGGVAVEPVDPGGVRCERCGEGRAVGQTAGKLEAALRAEQAELHARLQGSLSPTELADAGKRLKAVDDALAETEEAWLEVATLIEDLQNAAAL
jgi:hypothetical protein